ncbi:putative DNA binding domain-containing protein [Methanospirillum sp. J.3.6.1-F.2.7.3]|uniref:Putative DNA binding domain-containing protein n=1 Tax=Methanospirillum purgamenti TaxID=2834276 RepID=A0A8E7B1H7_9EURY|nr:MULTISPECIES: RNA-binding domain-containing protein [Methanospirillum]MDX8549361.1 putative DNA binding domain-containing protein [Methanospirillum hungatei]QVV89348.1 putative DNA binding domain-containing protein [Methanospirillum sp. J.3.6.1-F.2.7.3]
MNKYDIINLLKLGENQNVEFKLDCNNLIAIGNEVCALLNTTGGFVICGVNDGWEPIGIDNSDNQVKRLEEIFQNNLSPKAPIFISTQKVEDKSLVIIEVPKGEDIPYAFQNDIFLRVSNRTRRADIETIKDMVLRRQVEPERWERRLSLADINTDLSEKEIDAFIKAAKTRICFQLQEDTDKFSILEKFSLSKYGRLTNGGDVLFGKNPAIRFPQIRVQAVRFESDQTDDTYLDMKTFEGPLVSVLNDVFSFIQRNTPTISQFNKYSLFREDKPLYPWEAIREGLVNAFAHRDYSRFSGGIFVNVYKNRIEIKNSGRLPEGITPENLQDKGHLSVLRNPDIAHVLYLQGLMEKIGRGSLVIIKTCFDNGSPPPQWKDDDFGVSLTIYSRIIHIETSIVATASVNVQVTPEVMRFLNIMQGEMSRKDLQTRMKLKDDEHFRKAYLLPAIEAHLIEMTIPDKPRSRSQKYRLTENGRIFLSKGQI